MLLVLCATPALTTGANLAARRVIFRTPSMNPLNQHDIVDAVQFQQMAGRAGQKGVDDKGRSTTW